MDRMSEANRRAVRATRSAWPVLTVSQRIAVACTMLAGWA